MEYARYNGIDYKLVTESDGWISIYEYNPHSGSYSPLIQARDMEHAHSYCCMREPVPAGVNRI